MSNSVCPNLSGYSYTGEVIDLAAAVQRFFINLKGDEPANFNSNRPDDGNDEFPYAAFMASLGSI